ncbi:hypothetical protein, partial [Methylobrevis pamukkalensis]|uniref:hypothetical protein n=1 Tax=Methylobrevis pamukkalensis TaxID=1439726 RepID=UPI00114CAA6A
MATTAGDRGRTGIEEAMARIEACRATRSDTLDLGGLGLTEFPEAVLELGWLKALHFGYGPNLRDAVEKDSILRDQILENRNLFDSLPANFGT